MVQAEPETPEWKTLWDQARISANQEQYVEAAELYKELYQRKPNIEEAAWEYCKVLLRLEKFGEVEKIVDVLLEKNPHRNDYLLAGASIALRKANYSKAIDFYGRVFEKEPAGHHSDAALEGLANSLRLSGQKQLSFVLYEQLLLRKPDDRILIYQLAQDARELGFISKAAALYSRLLQYPVVDDQIIFQAANIFDAAGDSEKSSSLRRMYLKRHPRYLPFHKKLAEYYLQTENFPAALNHLSFLADNSIDNDELLLQAGNLCLQELNRPDKALQYFERYRIQNPDDQQILAKISDIQTILAGDFLAIVENEGASQLWQDLVEVAPNRRAIYLEMAELLERQGKIPEAIEILTIIHKNAPDDDQVALRIGHWYYFFQEYGRVLEILDTVNDKNKYKDFFILKGNTERQMGQEIAGLASLEEGLRLDPQDTALRLICLDLAGLTGLVDKLLSLFSDAVTIYGENLPYDLLAKHLEMLSYNFLFTEYTKVHDLAVHHFADRPEILAALTTRQVKTLRRSGYQRRAEQLLRQQLNGDRQIGEIFYTLTEDAIADRDFEAAKAWQTALQQISEPKEAAVRGFSDVRLLLLEMQRLRAEGDYEGGLEVFNDFRQKSGSIEELDIGDTLMLRLETELCRLNYYSRNYHQTLESTGLLLDKVDFDPELLTLRQLIDRDTGQKGGDRLIDSRLNIGGQPVVTRLIAVAGKEVEYKAYDAAKKHLDNVVGITPNSVVGNVLLAHSVAETGHLDRALAIYDKLSGKYPGEKYFIKKMVEIEVRRGRFDQALLLLDKTGINRGGQHHEMRGGAIDDLLILARLLWGDKQQEKSLQVYKQLLDPPVVDLLAEEFRKKQINYLYLTREHTFLSSMLLLLQSEPEIIGELMEPEFLIKNRGSEAGKVVTQYFYTYSWQRSITHEYLARTATYNRNYRYAEQSYRKFMEEEDSTEGMLDLATIYSRTGEYRKEAQVYEAIQDSGATSPELADSLERATFQLSPQSSIDGSYSKKSGRDDYINIQETSIGTSFWFTPALDKEVNFLYSNNRYESVDGDDKTGSNKVYGGATFDFANRYEFRFGGGMEILNGEGDTEFLYDIGLNGQLDDYVSGYLLFEKKPVYDTVAAIKDHIIFYAIETGLNFETSKGIALGGGVRHRNFSDGNAQNRFNGYSSYTIFGESLQLALRYDYQYIESDDGNDPEVDRAIDPLLYWSPAFYYQHRLSVHFQHDFLGYEQGANRGVSYYALDGAVGYEDDKTISYTGMFDIFLEISPHFLLKGNFTLSNSDQYEETGLSLSLHYRW